MTTKKEGVITIYNDKNELIALIVKDESSRKNIIYNASEAGLEEIEGLLKNQS
jgi:hypothetical protein